MKIKFIGLLFALVPMLALGTCFDSAIKGNGKQQIDALVKTAQSDGKYLKNRTLKKDRLIEKGSTQNCEWSGMKVKNVQSFACKITGFCNKLLKGEYCVGVLIQFVDPAIQKKFGGQSDKCFNMANLHPPS